MPRKRIKNWRRPQNPQKYFDIHYEYMDNAYDEEIILDDDLELNTKEYPVITLSGKVYFRSNLVLNVKKTYYIQQVGRSGRQLLHKSGYSYNLNYDGKDKSEIFRYDNSHEDHPHPGHTSSHHIHRFDPPGREKPNSPEELHEDDVPTLYEVFLEVHQYLEKLNKEKPKAKRKQGKKLDKRKI